MSTTELRTQSSQLVETLKSGGSVTLIHRSEVIGVIQPQKIAPKRFTKDSLKKLKASVKKMNGPSYTPEEIDRRYRKAMMQKHGTYLS